MLCSTFTGPMFVFAADGVIGRSLIDSGHFGEHKIDEVLAYLVSHHGFVPGTFVDIGANIGTHLVHALQPDRFTMGVGVEADSDNFRLLQANAAVRGLTNRCRLINVALSSEKGHATLERCPTNYGDHRIRVAGIDGLPDLGESARTLCVVQQDTADNVLAAADIDWSKTLTWMDTQGHEGQILAGATATLGEQAPAVVMEFWPYGLERAGGRKRYFEFLASCTGVYDISRADWPELGRVSLPELQSLYDTMLADTRAGFYPHTDLLCLRAALPDVAAQALSSIPVIPVSTINAPHTSPI